MADIVMEPVEGSTAIRAIGHDPDGNVLRVEFTNGSTYEYDDFMAHHFEAFKSAESAGRHHHSNIKGQFKHRRI